jgi:hypothetical protein
MSYQYHNKPYGFRYVEAVNGKTGHVSLEPIDGSITIDNSVQGRIRIGISQPSSGSGSGLSIATSPPPPQPPPPPPPQSPTPSGNFLKLESEEPQEIESELRITGNVGLKTEQLRINDT